MSPASKLTMAVVEQIIKFPPIFNSARDSARKRIMQRGIDIGVRVPAPLDATNRAAWERRLADVRNPSVTLPAYYAQKFHGYEDGNLGWEPALELETVAKAVHATVMDPANVAVDRDGDAHMRASFHRVAAAAMAELGCDVAAVRSVVDLACGIGLSSLAAAQAHPNAHVLGLDASAYFITAGQHTLLDAGRPDHDGAASRVQLTHSLAENTGLPAGSADVVVMCLLLHEVPAAAAAAILQEAHRILRPKGCLCIMEMDPRAPKSQKLIANPFAFAAFKSTEPWLEEYVNLDVLGLLEDVGFGPVRKAGNTPSHLTIVAQKA